MNSRTMLGCFALLVTLPAAPTLALGDAPGETTATSPDLSRPPNVLLGAGLTMGGTYRESVHPGVMLGVDLGLGTYAALGLTGDFTFAGESSAGASHEFLTSLELKLLPEGRSVVRPWLSGGIAASIVNDLKLGLGVGGGMYFAPGGPRIYFVDARHYRMSGFETSDYGQTMVRAGVAF